MIKVAIIGIQGVPANYGGFESLVDNLLGENCPEDIHYTVFCSGKDMPQKLKEYKGATLKYVPLKANGIQSIPYDIISLCRSINAYDVILVLGVSGCIFLPIYSILNSKKLIINIDGQEYKRAKWGAFAKWILRLSEALAVRYADVVIADNKGIQDYVKDEYGKEATLIAYGGDHVNRTLAPDFVEDTLKRYGLKKNGYAITVCRIEPENNCETVLDAFTRSGEKLVFIGNWEHSDYASAMKEKYRKYDNLILIDAIYDLNVLYALRSNARIYVHGHSAGGTNPSLVEAMHFGIPVICYDVVFNRETTENKAYYFNNQESLLDLIRRSDLDGNAMKEIADRKYTWKTVSRQYSDLYRD